MASIRAVAVVAPARNEEELLPACLTAVSAASLRLESVRPEILVTTIVVLDRCHDASARVVQRFGVQALPVQVGSVGVARAAGVQAALAWSRSLGVPDDGMWIAVTDADSVVPANWLSLHTGLADAGADVVVGTVEPVGVEDPVVLAHWYARHTLAEDHPHVHGANLGVRASTYVAAGGFPAISEHEDVELVASARALGAKVLATDRCRVATSGRRVSRVAAGGFSGYLRELAG